MKEKEKEKKKVLLKDIVIPKGTVFYEASKKVEYFDDNHFETIIGLSKNTTGEFTYCIDDDFDELDDYFTNLKE